MIQTEAVIDSKSKWIVEEVKLSEKYGSDYGVSIRKHLQLPDGTWTHTKTGIFLSLTKSSSIIDDSGEEIELPMFEAVITAALALLSELKMQEE